MAHLKLQNLKIIRETPKAYLFAGGDMEDLKSDPRCTTDGWIPKSQIVSLQSVRRGGVVRTVNITLADYLREQIGASKNMLSRKKPVNRLAFLMKKALATQSSEETPDLQLQFVINGYITAVTCATDLPLAKAAKKASRNVNSPIDVTTSLLLDEKGAELSFDRSPAELLLRDGSLLFVTPPAGVGG